MNSFPAPWSKIKQRSRDFPDSPVVKTSPSSSQGVGLIPAWGAKILCTLGPRNLSIKQKQYHDKFDGDFKEKHDVYSQWYPEQLIPLSAAWPQEVLSGRCPGWLLPGQLISRINFSSLALIFPHPLSLLREAFPYRDARLSIPCAQGIWILELQGRLFWEERQ